MAGRHPSRIRTLIVDDEPLGRDGVRILLEQDADFQVVGESADGFEALRAIGELNPEVLFLDVKMPRMSGFELLKRIPKEQLPLVVFVTAFDHFAIPAFEVHALDYLLKPLNAGRFQQTLARIKSYLGEKRQVEVSARLASLLDELSFSEEASPARSYRQRFPIRNGDNIYFVNTAEIDWIEATDYYARLHTGKQSHLIRETLANLEKGLDPAVFMRIHRSTIVRIDRIKSLKRIEETGYELTLQDGTKLRLSRSYVRALQNLLGKE